MVVKQCIAVPELPTLRLLSQVNACTNRNIAEFEQVRLISFNRKQCPQLAKELVHFHLLRLRVSDVRQLDPLQERALQLLLERWELLRSKSTQGLVQVLFKQLGLRVATELQFPHGCNETRDFILGQCLDLLVEYCALDESNQKWNDLLD